MQDYKSSLEKTALSNRYALSGSKHLRSINNFNFEVILVIL